MVTWSFHLIKQNTQNEYAKLESLETNVNRRAVRPVQGRTTHVTREVEPVARGVIRDTLGRFVRKVS